MKEAKVLAALRALGGEASSIDVRHELIRQSRWPDKLAPFTVTVAGVTYCLYHLEKQGVLSSRWGEATEARNWYRPRIYKIERAEQ